VMLISSCDRARCEDRRPSFKVPESFTRAFDGMRSANEALAQVAWIGIGTRLAIGLGS
jgi:hypothetical protein